MEGGREEGNEYLYERSFAYIAQVIAVDAIKQLQIVNFCRVSHETFAYRHETCSETASPMEQVEKAPPRFVWMRFQSISSSKVLSVV